MPLKSLVFCPLLLLLWLGTTEAVVYSVEVKVGPNADPATKLRWKVQYFEDGVPTDDTSIEANLISGAGSTCDCSFSWPTLTTWTLDVENNQIHGLAYFGYQGGGCLKPSIFAAAPITSRISSNGHEWEIDSWLSATDAVDDTGKLPGQTGWNPSGHCRCTLSDATFHTPQIKTGAFNFCTDYNADGKVDLDDAVLTTPSIKAGFTCVRP